VRAGYSIVFCLIAFLSAGCGRVVQHQEASSADDVTHQTSTSTRRITFDLPISRQFMDPKVFQATEGLGVFGFTGRPVAGVVNHHVLAVDLIARFFKTLKASRPDITTFIILSPDHFSRGRGVSTSRLPYVTPAGTVDITALNVTSTGVWDGTPARAFEQEHGVGALAPFVAREFPQAKIMPIFLRADVRPEDASALGKALAASSDDKTFVVVSSDMSHFLREKDARAHDADTIAWLESGSWDKLESATDKNTDSAVGLAILNVYLKQKAPLTRGDAEGGYQFFLLSHKLSTDYVADPNNTTSYIVGFWE